MKNPLYVSLQPGHTKGLRKSVFNRVDYVRLNHFMLKKYRDKVKKLLSGTPGRVLDYRQRLVTPMRKKLLLVLL